MTNKPKVIYPSPISQENLQQEFDRFVYAISHDFNTPMRQVREFSKLLVQSLEDQLGESEKKYVHFIVRNIQQMETMLSGLLAYSRLNTRRPSFTTVNCQVLLKEVKQLLQRRMKRLKATIQVDSLPQVVGEASRLKQLFYHLLSNAIHFRKPDSAPKITISAGEKEEEWCFKVTDYGIGIASNQYQKIFELFSQLQPGDPDHCGIGLTICKKIVEFHGGAIWVESIENEQTTFYFTHPKQNYPIEAS